MKRLMMLLFFSAAVFAQQHGLSLAWTAGTCPTGQNCGATANYNVMRSTTSGGPYTQIAQTTGTVTTFLDTTGVPGTKYFYVIQALASGAPPAQSGEGSGVFPFPPAPAPGPPTVTQQ